MSDMRSADSRTRFAFMSLGAGVVLGAALVTLGVRQALTGASLMPILAVMLGAATAALCVLALGRLAFMERRAARIRRRWGSQ